MCRYLFASRRASLSRFGNLRPASHGFRCLVLILDCEFFLAPLDWVVKAYSTWSAVTVNGIMNVGLQADFNSRISAKEYQASSPVYLLCHLEQRPAEYSTYWFVLALIDAVRDWERDWEIYRYLETNLATMRLFSPARMGR
ncbi:hypothetical protein CVT26_011509 [Gymnopilus dilepis]|uniref:Uncharacterized protein n=1 Tax=Gymnopilus dilepis TaxID=231916 RepID=A0A409WNH6_9AGAR|nr:hypothetical protein CVT26_011509 [Gymnopilus dilepis]